MFTICELVDISRLAALSRRKLWPIVMAR